MIGRDRSEAGASKLEEETLRQLFWRTSELRPASDIGWQHEPWKTLRTIALRTTTGERFRITVATRASLRHPIVILEEESESGVGFYVGEDFWEWLRRVPEANVLGGK